ASIDLAGDPARLQWSAGALTITGTNGLALTPGGPIGATLALNPGAFLTTPTFAVRAGGTLTLVGGALAAGLLDVTDWSRLALRSGSVTIAAGTTALVGNSGELSVGTGAAGAASFT